MRKFYILIMMMALATAAWAQDRISVASFKLLPNDLTPITYGTEVKDQNGQTCALIKVETTQTGFTFDFGMMTPMKIEQKVGEIWVYIPFGVKRVTIQHQLLGTLRDYSFPVSIEKGKAYLMKLITGTVDPRIIPSVTSQFLVFNISPKDAMLTVDGTPWPVTDGVAQKMMDFGTYEYRIEAPDYHPCVGKVTVNDPDKKQFVNETLKPAFGFLKIEGDNNILSKSSIYIDNANGADALNKAKQLGSGQHKVRIVHSKYKPYEKTVTIKDGETFTLNAILGINFSTVTLKVDADAEIWVNGERKGTRTWTGDLVAGTYTMECRQENHKTSLIQKAITENMSGEVITLTAPTPINGTLVVSSNPPMANLSIDGKPMGETPLRVNAILIGNHTLRLEKSGCAPLVKTITIEEGKTLTLDEKLDTGRSITVKTDRAGDKIYIDDTFVGETPRETPLGFGQHTIRVVRNGIKVEKNVDIKENTRNGIELNFEFGRLITINTDRRGDIVLVDGEQVGTSPVQIDLPFGRHTIHAQRDKKYADKNIEVIKDGGLTEHSLVLHGETASHFVKNGVNFVTLNGACDIPITPLISYGFGFGSVKRIGWFVTAMSNFRFDAMNYDKVTDSHGLVEGYYPSLEGPVLRSRISVMGGLIIKLGGPVYFRMGAGYGSCITSQKSADGDIVRISSYTIEGVDATAGLQMNLKGFTLSADAVTTNFKTIEAKIGLGYCWKRK